uniref:ATP synthase subunit b, chloroplastic n=1 Tax=Pharnaceum aurantium TaxID=2518628 RepID=A0A411L920_9CARY|nr:ATP synthase CF0 subunit I [Pharnaceum aurantium]
MKNGTDSFVFFGHWPFAGSFGLNTDILATNLINLTVVIGVLIVFGKGVLSDLLDNRKQRILNTIQNSEELSERAIEQLEKARSRLRNVEKEANQFRLNGYLEIEREKMTLIQLTYKTFQQLENDKNETIQLEQQRAINQVRQRVFQQALEGALATLTKSFNKELHLRTINANIGMLRAIKEIRN